MFHCSIIRLAHTLNQSKLKLTATIALLVVITHISGCANKPQSTDNLQASATDHVWPAPPAKPRIRYVGTLNSEESLTGEKKRSLRDWFLGTKEETKLVLTKPYGVHSDSKGRVFVADTGIAGLVVFDLNKKEMVFWGTSGPGALKKPTGVTTDQEGNVYVSDVTNHRIVKFDKQGVFLTAFGGSEHLISPVGLVVDEETQQLYVVDSKKHQVIVFNMNGQVEFTIGSRGSGNGEFNFPTNIAMDRKGQLYVADTMNFRVQIFDKHGTHVSNFGKLGDRRGQFSRLKGIGIDSEGHIYAVDAAFNNVQIFNDKGELLLTLGQAGTGPGGFYLPAGAHVDHNNKIYVADQLNLRIQIFEYIGGE
ncbi:MAG: 6-bladed beta-propeller [Candidatus Thiodiazotropha sp.]